MPVTATAPLRIGGSTADRLGLRISPAKVCYSGQERLEPQAAVIQKRGANEIEIDSDDLRKILDVATGLHPVYCYQPNAQLLQAIANAKQALHRAGALPDLMLEPILS
jgi:hypothetical protein